MMTIALVTSTQANKGKWTCRYNSQRCAKTTDDAHNVMKRKGFHPPKYHFDKINYRFIEKTMINKIVRLRLGHTEITNIHLLKFPLIKNPQMIM